MNGNTHHRQARVAEAIRQYLAEALITQVKDPRVGLATVSRVNVSADLSHARVLVSVSGTGEEISDTLEGLTSAAGFLRSGLAGRLRLRSVPELEFIYDQGLHDANRMYELLDRLKEEGGND